MKDYTELVFILDRSGSMSGLEKDTIGGFNNMIEKQKREGNKAVVSTVLFDTQNDVIHDRVPLNEIKPMTRNDYYVGGCTALLDAMGSAIRHIGNVHKYSREEDRPKNTLFVIITDGEENSSRKYNYSEVEKLVERQKKKYDWEFIFLGANMDVVKEARKFGITEDRAVEYCCDEEGTKLSYDVLGDVVRDYSAGMKVPCYLKRRIEDETKRRRS